MDDQTRTEIEAAAFRKLLAHLQYRTDVQNIDLMGLGGFCRNCLSDWYQEAANEKNTPLDKEAARRAIYGMAYADFKEKYQTPATQAQLAAMKEGVKKNEGRGF